MAAPEQAHAADPIPIAEIQGTGASTPKAGQVVTTTPSRVTAVYGQGATAEFRGFVIQTPGTGGAGRDLTPSLRRRVRVPGHRHAPPWRSATWSVSPGPPASSAGLTQIGGAVTVTKVTGSFPTVRPLTGLRWADTVAQRENLESMLYASSERFTVSDTFPLLRFGELGLTSAELPLQPTEVARPGSAEARRRRRATWPSGSTWMTAPTVASPGRRRWRPARCRTCPSGWRWPSVTGCG